MFPETNDIAFSSSADSYGSKSYLFDFDAGDFVIRDGKLVECDGLDAVKVWIEKILRTEKDRFTIYDDTEYGTHIEDLIIGTGYCAAFIESELKREIEESLLKNLQISAVSNITITRGISTLTIELEVTLGDTGENTVTVTV